MMKRIINFSGRRARRRGAMYVAVLGVSTLVMTVGLSALMALRIERRRLDESADVVQARMVAQTFSEVVLIRLGLNSNWRTTYLNNIWTSAETFGPADVSFKLVDEVDADLDDDASDPVRVYSKATVGEAVRVQSVLLEVGATPNLLGNPGMEKGTQDWTGDSLFGRCTISESLVDPNGGARCLLATNRDSSWAGPGQDVTNAITNGTTYYIEVWVKGTVDANDILVFMDIDSTFGLSGDGFSGFHSGRDWFKVSGTLTPSWLGSLNSAQLHIETNFDTSDFFIDDAILVEGTGPPVSKMEVVAGSWRREPAS